MPVGGVGEEGLMELEGILEMKHATEKIPATVFKLDRETVDSKVESSNGFQHGQRVRIPDNERQSLDGFQRGQRVRIPDIERQSASSQEESEET